MYLAQIMGVTFVAVGLAFLLDRKLIGRVMTDLFKSPALMYTLGFMILVLGYAMVHAHNIWDGLWYQTVITVIAWLTLVKGIMYLVFPGIVKKMAKSVYGSSNMVWLPMLVCFGAGICLLCVALL